jgi:hypothetical protein
MPNFASFVSFLARDETEAVVVQPGHTQSITGDIPLLDDLDPTHNAVLAFKLTTIGTVTLTIKINGHNQLAEQKFGPDSETVTRVWHEIINKTNLKRRNTLDITASDGTGHVELSDFVLSYRRKDPPRPAQPHGT